MKNKKFPRKSQKHSIWWFVASTSFAPLVAKLTYAMSTDSSWARTSTIFTITDRSNLGSKFWNEQNQKKSMNGPGNDEIKSESQKLYAKILLSYYGQRISFQHWNFQLGNQVPFQYQIRFLNSFLNFIY